MEDPIQTTTNPQNPSQKNNKRLLENGHIPNSNFSKIRAIVKDIRPHFIEVLKAPEFRTCVAAQEIRDQIKVMMKLYKEMMAETISMSRCTSMPSETPETQDVKEGVNAVAHKIGTVDFPEDPQSEGNRPQGTFIIGGSPVGWNFITYPGGKAVYYGRTKETFSAQNTAVRNDLPKEK